MVKMSFANIVISVGVLAGVANGVPLPSDPKPFIIGGAEASIGYAPYMAALISSGTIFCGVSIISEKLVLTAAHCVFSFNGELLDNLYIRAGSNKWNSGGITVDVGDIHVHPKWDRDTIKYDAAILELKEDLVFSEYIGVVRLGYDFVEGNVSSVVTGWGRTGPRIEGNVVHLQPTPDDLQILYMNTIDHNQCQEQMLAIAGARAPPIQEDIEICTFHSRGHGMCVGDSGSPLIRVSTREQVGLVSWGYNCAIGAPDVYVRLSGIRDFVERILDLYRE
ncbi:hypothetical protein B5X24_HaOG200518 [Helicoverpa armigera]|uniref:trypsin n=1 Tax=Helicoverpa armigera TaxID=29058 RepID=A0A2W1BHD3_HELAM|nr:hypothetical protein B5X24_HaOG200518 [Helicoverpa armigera]